MNLSIVIPLLNEEESLSELFFRINKVCSENEISYENCSPTIKEAYNRLKNTEGI